MLNLICMNKRGFSTVLIAILGGATIFTILVFFTYKLIASSRESSYEPSFDKNGELVFLSSENVQKIHESVDSSTSLSDFDYKFYNSFADSIENSTGSSASGTFIAPQVMSDKNKAISINEIDASEGFILEDLEEEDLPTLKNFAHIFVDEVTKYPVQWMEYSFPPTAFVFDKKVRLENGDQAGGVTREVIIYDVTSADYDTEYTRRIIHHEISHFIDLMAFGPSFEDENWPGLKTNEDDYSGVYDTEAAENHIEHPSAGFVTGYAETNVQEDKAELYSYLFTKEGNIKLQKWIAEDEQLRQKVTYLKDFISARLHKMDENYWTERVLGE